MSQITNIPIKMQRSNYIQVIVFLADENIECFYTNAMKSAETVQPITKWLSNHTLIVVPQKTVNYLQQKSQKECRNMKVLVTSGVPFQVVT
jgi:hypothetical protein